MRTYPTPARKGVEVSCTGGITDDGKWVRLFPVSYRFLTTDKRFRKYQWIAVRVAKSSDFRQESFEIDRDSIEILTEPLPTSNKWEVRKAVVYPLKAHCLCCLEAQRKAEGTPTLGFFKPKNVRRFLIRKDEPNWSEEDLGRLSQYSLFENAPREPLEKIPYKFIYQLVCDEETCKGHHLSCVDWELGESYRQWRRQYGDRWRWAIENKYANELVYEKDLHFFVGTIRAHPASWIITGLFYPPK